MSNDNYEIPPKKYTLKPRTIPLPSNSSAPKIQSSLSQKQKVHHPIVREANEDDDLYDPYSDIHDGTLKPLKFEEDPWK